MAKKISDDQGVEEYRRRLEKARFEEQEIEKMTVELKELIEKATTKKEEVLVKGAKGTRKKNEWWDK
jgi:adenylosuccinate synthase